MCCVTVIVVLRRVEIDCNIVDVCQYVRGADVDIGIVEYAGVVLCVLVLVCLLL